jgi:hypothetical protein
LQEIPAGKILVGAILMVSVTTVGWYLLSSIGIYGQEGWLLRGLGLIVGLGLNTAGIILLPLTVSVCVYAIFGPGFIGMDKETLHTVLAAIASGFFPYLEKKSASASVVIAIIAVPVCSYVSFGSGFDDSVTNITDVVLGVNLIVIVKYLQS